MDNKIYQIFISSSFHEDFDLGFTKEREFVKKLINEASDSYNLKDISLDAPKAYAQSTFEKSLQRVEQADVVILFIGNRYGSIRKDGKSLTHLEYKKAKETNKIILAYIFPTDESSPDRDKIENFKKEIIEDDYTRDLDLRELFKDNFIDVLEAKSKKIKKLNKKRIEEFCMAFSAHLLAQLLEAIGQDKDERYDKVIAKLREDLENERKKTKKWKYMLIALAILALFSLPFFHDFWKKEGIEDSKKKILRSEQLKKEIEKIKYKIRHTKNDTELVALFKELNKKQKELNDIALVKKSNPNKMVSKIIDENGTKAAYEYITQNDKKIQLENDEYKLSKQQLTRAILAFNMQKFDEANKYCMRAISNYPSFETNLYCASSLYLQSKKNEAKKIFKDTLKLSTLSEENRAVIYTSLAYNSSKYKDYFEKAIEIYKNLKNKTEYYHTLVEYANLLIAHNDNMVKEIIDTLDKEFSNFKDNGKILFEYWQMKARYFRNINNGEMALYSIKEADKYKNIIKDNNSEIVSAEFLKLKTIIFREQNEVKDLEKIYNDRLTFSIVSAKKFPLEIKKASKAYMDLIDFYNEQQEYKKAEQKFVEWIKFLKKYTSVKSSYNVNSYDDFIMMYKAFLSVRGYKKKSIIILSYSKKLRNKIFNANKIDINKANELNKTNKIVINNKLFEKLKTTNSTIAVGSIIAPMKTEKEIQQIKQKIMQDLKSLEILNSNSTTYHIPKHEIEFLKYKRMSKIASNYMNLGLYGRMIDWYKKAYKTISKLANQNIQRYGYHMIVCLNNLAIWEKDRKYQNQLQLIYEKFMKKNRNKYLPMFATSKYIQCGKLQLIYELEKAEKMCKQSLDLFKELERINPNRYIATVKHLYGDLINIERNKPNPDYKKIEQYKQARRDIRKKIEENKVDTSGRSFNLIVSNLDKIVKILNTK